MTGPPASGKSTLAKQLASDLGLPLIAKDELKVILYDTLGWGGRDRDRATSDAAYQLIYHLAGAELQAGRSVLLESNFRPEAGERLAELQRRHGAGVVQIRCWAGRDVLVGRLQERVGARHPGHADGETLGTELESLLVSGAALPLDGPLIEIDTTGPRQVDVDALAEKVFEVMREE